MSHVTARTAETLRHMAHGSSQLEGAGAAVAVGATIAALFAGSTLLTPLYVTSSSSASRASR